MDMSKFRINSITTVICLSTIAVSTLVYMGVAPNPDNCASGGVLMGCITAIAAIGNNLSGSQSQPEKE